MSLLFTIRMIDVVSRTLGLGLDSEVAKLSAEVDAVAKAEMKPAIERLQPWTRLSRINDLAGFFRRSSSLPLSAFPLD